MYRLLIQPSNSETSDNIGVWSKSLGVNPTFKIGNEKGDVSPVTGRIFKPNGSNPLSGAIVSASLSDGRFVASAITNSNGNFNFRGIPAGDYHFCVTPLEGGMTSANLTSNYAVNTSFAPTFNWRT